MKQYISNCGGLMLASTYYMSLMGYGSPSFYTYVGGLISAPGTLRNFFLNTETAPGAGNSNTVDLMVNGGVALTVTISDTDTTGIDTGGVSVSPGDIVYYRTTRGASAPNTYFTCVVEFEGDNANESLLVPHNQASYLINSAVRYQPLTGGVGPNATEAHVVIVAPTSGSLKNFYVKLSDAPGASKSWDFTLRVNGADTALTVNIAGASAVTGSDTAHSVSISAGDLICMSITPTNSPYSITKGLWGMTFVADSDGESIVGGCMGGTNLVNYTNQLAYLNAAYTLTSSSLTAKSRTFACVLKKLYVELQASPYVNSTTEDLYVFTLDVDGSPSALTCTVVDGGTGNKKASDTSHSVSLSDYQNYDLGISPASSPLATPAAWGMVSYVAPTGGSEITPSAGSLSASGVAGRNDRGISVPTEISI